MARLLDIVKVAEILGVDTKTLRRWDDEGKLKAIRTLGNHRRYREEDINTLINGEMQSRKSLKKKGRVKISKITIKAMLINMSEQHNFQGLSISLYMPPCYRYLK